MPNPGIQFYGDAPGTERIVMVASTRSIDFTTQGKAGDFLIGKAADLDEQIKALRIRGAAEGERRDNDTVMEELSISIEE